MGRDAPAEDQESPRILDGDLAPGLFFVGNAKFWRERDNQPTRSPAGYVCAEKGRPPAAPLPRTKHPRIVVLCVLCARPDPNPVPRHDDEVIEALRRGRPRRQGIDDAAETKARKGGAAIPKGGGGRGRGAEGAEVEEDGEGEEEREEERA